MAKKRAAPNWNEIASFYAGRPVSVLAPRLKPGAGDFDWSNTYGGNIHGGTVNLAGLTKKSLDNWKNPVLGAMGLATLIHEAIHLRKMQEPNAPAGFRDWYDEDQAHALGSELVADLLQRFFGIPISSKRSREYQKAVKSLSNYQAAYANAPKAWW